VPVTAKIYHCTDGRIRINALAQIVVVWVFKLGGPQWRWRYRWRFP